MQSNFTVIHVLRVWFVTLCLLAAGALAAAQADEKAATHYKSEGRVPVTGDIKEPDND